ncbi:MAG: hypothetical protein ACEY3L_09290 [Wolbachia sp.]
MSFQCLTLESSFPYNLIENVVTTFYASLLVNNLDPSSQGTGMTPFFFLDSSVWALPSWMERLDPSIQLLG